MKLIIGLGNPGAKYAKTRHNLGFLAVDAIAAKFIVHSSWFVEKKFQTEILKINQQPTINHQLILVKPQTFVNKSGVAIKKIVDFYKLEPSDVLVIRDDIDLPEDKIRGPKAETGSGGHLGVESIITNLGTNSFYQLKIGVGRPQDLDPADFVLGKVDNKKWQYFEKLIKNEVVKRVKDWLNE